MLSRSTSDKFIIKRLGEVASNSLFRYQHTWWRKSMITEDRFIIENFGRMETVVSRPINPSNCNQKVAILISESKNE